MANLHFKKDKYSNNGFEMFSFVASSRMNEKGKEQMSYLFYDGKKKRIWSTDGHRAHLAYIDLGEEDRCFKVILQKKNEIILEDMPKEDFPNRPNLSLVLSNARFIAKQDVVISDKNPEIAYVKLMRLFKKSMLDQSFFNSLAILFNRWTALIQDNEEDAVFFKCEKCLAVIMPMNIN
jgi:hypothetical protein